jgi:hypothetical protein
MGIYVFSDRGCRQTPDLHLQAETMALIICTPGSPVLMWQTIGMFEIFHAAFDLSPGASITAVCVTFAERMMLLIACLLPFPQLRANAYVTVPFIAWSVTNVVRFA